MKHLNTKFSIASLTIIYLLFAFTSKAQIITTVAGNATSGYSGDGGKATTAELSQPWGVAIDAAGNIYTNLIEVCTLNL